MIRKDKAIYNLVKHSIRDTIEADPQEITLYFNRVGMTAYEIVERAFTATSEIVNTNRNPTPRNIAWQMVLDYGVDELISEYIACSYDV